jgi:16S rRNA A1518/A1519 N6-dimethyltransferase RsmA/KsgA/DIM1 with predicted DNA glycosylase/AP lyase activity
MWTYLGQNFLNNEEIIDFIVKTVENNSDKNLDTIEIWPWKCALTKKLVKIFPQLKLFEKDENFYEILQKCVKKENIIMWDFLSANLSKYLKWDFFNAFGNLPYYITSPIFRKLTHSDNYPKMKYGIFMIQKEVWEKIKTNASKKSMLWFLLNFNYDIEYLKTVPAKDFTPPPKVDSCLVSFKYVWNKISWDFEKLNELLKIMMMYKKKSLWKIKKILEKQWKKFDLPDELLNKRMHQLSWEEIEKIKF